MTEPTEADFAVYDAARERANKAWSDPSNDPRHYQTLDEFERREFAQAIAEARAQGEAKMRAWFISHTVTYGQPDSGDIKSAECFQ